MMIDLFSSEVVEIAINSDGTKLWINTENGCVCRIYRIGKLLIDDARPTERKEEKNVDLSSSDHESGQDATG